MKNFSRIGIQFNWVDDKSFPLKIRIAVLNSGNLNAEEHHLDIGFSELGNHNLRETDRLELMNIIAEALPLSDFSNCYFSFLLPLTPTERAAKRLFTTPEPNGDFLDSFPEGALRSEISEQVRADYRYPLYNELYALILKTASASSLSVVPGIEFNDKEEWGQPEDEIRVVLEVE